MTKKKPSITIYTDGGCDPNPGVGGWASVLLYNKHVKEISGGEPHTTNNRMELMAAIKALETLKEPCTVRLHTDSEYVKRGITEWLPAWKRNNWRRKRGAVKNLDLWQRLDSATQEHEIAWEWVPGHAGIHYNERCDQLANKAITKQKRTGHGSR